MHLTGIDLLDWIGLRRVHEGGVARHGVAYLQWGRTVPCYLPEVFDRVAQAKLTELLDPDSTGLRRVVCTSRGIDRYQELTTKRASWADPEQPSGVCSVPPTGRGQLVDRGRSEPHRRGQPGDRTGGDPVVVVLG